MNGTTDELDQLAKAVTRAGGISDDEAERISSSPFLHTRVRARIEAEQRKRVAQGSGWFATLLVASRAIVALLLVTIAAAGAFWTTTSRTGDNAALKLSSALEPSRTDDINRVVVGGTCALSSTELCAISTEEVLATMFAPKRGNEDRGNGDGGKENK
jgi:hypothetical protein